MLSLEDAEVGKPEAEMWKLWPDPALSADSTEGNGSGSFGPAASGGGGVRARCSGDALYWCCCRKPRGRKPGGRDDRLLFAPPPPPTPPPAAAVAALASSTPWADVPVVEVEDGGKFGD